MTSTPLPLDMDEVERWRQYFTDNPVEISEEQARILRANFGELKLPRQRKAAA